MKRYGIHKLFLLFLIAGSECFFSCNTPGLDPFAYVKWIDNEEHGLRVKKEIGNFEFQLQYKPLEYIAVVEKKNPLVQKSIMDERVKKLKGMQYYNFKISSKIGQEILNTDVKEVNEEYYRLQYFVGEAQNDISLIEGKDTLPCLLYHFERNYNVAPYNVITVGFEESKQPNQDKNFVFNDQVLGTGIVRLAIKAKDINRIPVLKLN